MCLRLRSLVLSCSLRASQNQSINQTTHQSTKESDSRLVLPLCNMFVPEVRAAVVGMVVLGGAVWVRAVQVVAVLVGAVTVTVLVVAVTVTVLVGAVTVTVAVTVRAAAWLAVAHRWPSLASKLVVEA